GLCCAGRRVRLLALQPLLRLDARAAARSGAAVLLRQPGPDLYRSRQLGAVPGLSRRLGVRLRLWLPPSALRLSRTPLGPRRALLRPARAAPLLLIHHSVFERSSESFSARSRAASGRF